jgi:hypothetical protein
VKGAVSSPATAIPAGDAPPSHSMMLFAVGIRSAILSCSAADARGFTDPAVYPVIAARARRANGVSGSAVPLN